MRLAPRGLDDGKAHVHGLGRLRERERKEREFDPTIEMLRRCVEDPALARLEAGAQKRLKETLSLMEALSGWTDEMLALETGTLRRLIRLGARVKNLLGRG